MKWKEFFLRLVFTPILYDYCNDNIHLLRFAAAPLCIRIFMNVHSYCSHPTHAYDTTPCVTRMAIWRTGNIIFIRGAHIFACSVTRIVDCRNIFNRLGRKVLLQTSLIYRLYVKPHSVIIESASIIF